MIENIMKLVNIIKVEIHKLLNYTLYKEKVKLFGVPYLIHRKNIEFGKGTRLNPHVVMYGHGGISIGKYVTLSHGVSIYSTGYITENWHNNKIIKEHRHSKVIIDDYTWIGANVIILKGVYIPEGCIIAAGSVVIKSLSEPNALYAGNPAKMIKKL